MLSLTFAATLPDDADALALPVLAGPALDPVAERLDQAAAGAGTLARALGLWHEPEKAGALNLATAPAATPAGQILLYGTVAETRNGAAAAAEADRAASDALALGGALAARANAARMRHLAVQIHGQGEAAARQAALVAEGLQLGAYRFDRYHTRTPDHRKPTLTQVTLVSDDPGAASRSWAAREPVVRGVIMTRDLVSEPANILYPASFAERCLQLTDLGLEVEVLGPAELQAHGFHALLAVNQGSAREPRVVILRHRGSPQGDAPTLVLIGKGVCFDSGGISIKPADGMEEMKWDMAGAGAVTGAMAALAGRKAQANVIGIIGLVENMPSGTAQRPGDVIQSMAGQTIEVINTDAEGRLVLADLVTYAQKHFDPALMIDLATLTGAMIIALGHEHAGLFSNSDDWAERLLAAGRATGERCWRMPLDKAYDQLIDSPIADIKNTGGRPAGSITAAHFIQRFVDKRDWIHLDIAGVAWSAKDRVVTPKGGTGFGVRLLDRFVAEHWERDAAAGAAPAAAAPAGGAPAAGAGQPGYPDASGADAAETGGSGDRR